MMHALVALTTAALITWVLAPLAAYLGKRMGVMSHPDSLRKTQTESVPQSGGLAVLAGLLVGTSAACLLVSHASPYSPCFTLLASATILSIVGLCDDVFQFSASRKILGQLVAGMPIVFSDLHVQRIAFGGCELDLGALGQPATLLWLLLGANALNLLDGMDGLASLVGALISAAMAIIAGLAGQWPAAIPAAALAGALAGFLAHNLPPARVYLGECGSSVVGWTLALLTLLVATHVERTLDLGTGAMLLFVPLLDTSLAIIRRTLRGRWFWVPDRGHLHHVLLDQRFTVIQALGILGALCLISNCLAGVQLLTQAWWTWIVLSLAMGVAVKRRWIAYHEWNLIVRTLGRLVAPSRASASQPAPTIEKPRWRSASAASNGPCQADRGTGVARLRTLDSIADKRRAA